MSAASSVTRHHAEWLRLVDSTGPFLSLPVLLRAFPQGLDMVDATVRNRLRIAYTEWAEADLAARPDLHDAWFRFVLREALGIEARDLRRGQDLPPQLAVSEAGETLRPTAAVAPDPERPPVLLLDLVPTGQDLDKYLAGRSWKASPAERMRMLLRATGVRVGLVTNGENWMLVDAPPGELASYATFTGDDLWFAEPLVLRALSSLLSLRRLVGVPDDEALPALLAASARDQHEVTDQLGRQVRAAVEVLIQTIDRIDRDRGRELLAGVDERHLYRAAVTVMMRLVFLFAAEERGLLVPLKDDLYSQHYAATTLRDQLEDLASRHGEEVLERRYDAWCRLLALARAVHGGITHGDLRLPAYGGSLFDPDVYPFLEGRKSEPDRKTTWREAQAAPLSIDNRTVLHLLRALQLLEVPLPGGATETRRLSFYGLSVEQIGHVYEGLLDHTAVRAKSPVLGLRGAKGSDPELSLDELERLSADRKALLERLRETTGRSADTLQRATGVHYSAPPAERRFLLRACDGDDALLARVEPWAPLLRRDTHQIPVVFPTGSLYVTQGAERRTTGTHYTPPELTEPIVRHTLDPLCYVGPAEGLPREQWQLREPAELLQLKICDLAMGSGAFLVQACRYLAARLLEAWESRERTSGGRLIKTPEGELAEGDPAETIVPRDAKEREIYAKRIVSDRCLFGVDKNPMAVEMAKLSLWLETLKRDAPFTFLDHALQPGDSLLGLSSAAQIEHFHVDPARGQELYGELIRDLYAHLGSEALQRASSARRKLESIEVREIHDIEVKKRLLAEANATLAELHTLADVIASSALHASRVQAGANERQRKTPKDASDLVTHTLESASLEGKLSLVLAALLEATDKNTSQKKREAFFQAIGEVAKQQLRSDPDGTPRAPIHWPLAFPEVLLRDGSPGFDAFVGNPPFQGGQKITGALGTDYRDYLVEHIAGGRRGSADLCAYFFLRASDLLRTPGQIGLVATNTIAQGDTREVGLDHLTTNGFEIIRAISSEPWPGEANLEVAHVWLRKGAYDGEPVLNRAPVPAISSALSKPGNVAGKPHRLTANEDKSFIGSYVLGMGFVLTPEEAQALIAKDGENSDVLFPYLNGEDLNNAVDQAPTRWVINFQDWPLDHNTAPDEYIGPVAADFPDCLDIVLQKVKPERDATSRKARRERWWQFAELARGLYARVWNRQQGQNALALSLVTHHLAFGIVHPGQVFSHKLCVFPTRKSATLLAALQSTMHEVWTRTYSSSLETRLNYSPSDCFETFPFPADLTSLEDIGSRYDAHRRAVMQATQKGLTKTYNRFHDPKEQEPAIVKLRELHVEMDRAVARAYDWSDLDLGHGFHQTKQGLRFTVSEPARREILDRLLALNHARYAEEVAAGLHKPARKSTPSRPRSAETTAQTGMDFEAGDEPAPAAESPAPRSPKSPRKPVEAPTRETAPTAESTKQKVPRTRAPAAAAPESIAATKPEPPAAPPKPAPTPAARKPAPAPPGTLGLFDVLAPAAPTPPRAPAKPALERPSSNTPDLDAGCEAILAALRRAPGPQTKAELLAATGLSADLWPDILRRLVKETAQLTQEGQARGTRYRLNNP